MSILLVQQTLLLCLITPHFSVVFCYSPSFFVFLHTSLLTPVTGSLKDCIWQTARWLLWMLSFKHDTSYSGASSHWHFRGLCSPSRTIEFGSCYRWCSLTSPPVQSVSHIYTGTLSHILLPPFSFLSQALLPTISWCRKIMWPQWVLTYQRHKQSTGKAHCGLWSLHQHTMQLHHLVESPAGCIHTQKKAEQKNVEQDVYCHIN